MTEGHNILRPEGAENDPFAVDASPTKAFFCNVITRDLSLDQAIADLVDNCVDGAKRLRGVATGSGNENLYDGLRIELSFDKNSFCLTDNCGGIDIDTARKYAFKFGRDESFKGNPGSVGQFGVGMKRALFKMGEVFEVKTSTSQDEYTVSVDVKKWLSEIAWDFRITDHTARQVSLDQTGTTITARNLYSGVSDLLGANYFSDRVKSAIKVSQQHFIRCGLTISVNGETLISSEWQLKSGSNLSPYFKKYTDGIEPSVLFSRIYSGIGNSSPQNAGWYVFCNGRCILAADQSNRTGWGDLPGVSSITIPKFHSQFSKFRGYAFLDSYDAERLPWNTTKTDLDFDHPEYMRLRLRIIEATRPVIDFLNQVDSEMDLPDEDRSISIDLDKSPLSPISRVSVPQEFRYSKPTVRGPVMKSISYKKPDQEVKALQKEFGASNARDVGLKSFEYALSRLVSEEDL